MSMCLRGLAFVLVAVSGLSWPAVVLANGRCLRVGPGFDPHTLVALVDLLEARGPSC